MRGVIPLLWATALTVAALQHAREVDRRTNLQEPSALEFEMRARSTNEIKAAWREINDLQTDGLASAGVEQRDPVPETAAVVETAADNPASTDPIARPAIDMASAKESTSLQRIAKIASRADDSFGAARIDAPTPISLLDTSEPADARHQGSDLADAPARDTAKDDVAPRPKEPGRGETAQAREKAKSDSNRPPEQTAAEPADRRPPRIRVHRLSRRGSLSSRAYYAALPQPLDGHSPRYFTIERPGRVSP